jgi:hypothetical protein
VAAARKSPTKAKAAKRVQPVKRKPANLRTQVSDASVPAFLAGIADDGQREDCKKLAALFASVTKQKPRMWGGRIVGYGEFPYVGKSGGYGNWFLAGFAPQKATLSLYMLGGWARNKALLTKLGKHKLGMGCLYLKRLSDVDQKALKSLVTDALRRARQQAPKMNYGYGAAH